MNGRSMSSCARRASRAAPIPLFAALLLTASLPLPVAAQASESPAPTDQPAAAASQGPVASGAEVSFPAIGGETAEVLTFSGPEWVARFESGPEANAEFVAQTRDLVASVGAPIEDLTVRTALAEPTPGNQAAVMAVSVAGVPAQDFASAAIRLMLGDVTMPELLLREFDDRWVLRVADAAIPGVYPRTVYLHGDTAWIIEADEDVVAEVVSQLPAPAPSLAETDPADPLVARLPLTLDGQRRDGLYEVLDWFGLPSAQAALEGQLEGDLARLYLEAGITPADVVGAFAWWGEELEDDAVLVEGFRLPGADPEVVQRFLSDIILAGSPEPADGGEPRSEDVAGRSVTVLEVPSEFGPEVRYYFSSGDVAWVVTDYTAEQIFAEDAIASLP